MPREKKVKQGYETCATGKCDFIKYLKGIKCPYADDPMMLIACGLFKLTALAQAEMMMSATEPDIEGYS